MILATLSLLLWLKANLAQFMKSPIVLQYMLVAYPLLQMMVIIIISECVSLIDDEADIMTSKFDTVIK